MSDLLDALREPTGRSPLPSDEVRRRGDRRRRRRAAVGVLGAAGLVAAIVATGSLVGGAGPTPRPLPPATTEAPPDSGADAIPHDFPLTLGWPATNGDGSAVSVVPEPAPALDGVDLCNERWWTARPALLNGVADTAHASYTGESEDQRARSLVVFDEESTAVAALQQARDVIGRCDGEEGWTDAAYEPLDLALAEEATGFTTRFRTEFGFDTGLVVHQMVRVGAAVLVTYGYGEGGGSPESIGASLDREAADLRPLVRAMCIYAAEPCSADAPPVGPQAGDAGLTSLGPAGVGPFRLGMSQAEVRGVGGRVVSEDGVCDRFEARLGDGGLVAGMFTPGLGLSDLATSDPVTAEGIGIGATLDELRAVYPDGTWDDPFYFAAPDGYDDRSYRIEVADGRVFTVQLLLDDQGCGG